MTGQWPNIFVTSLTVRHIFFQIQFGGLEAVVTGVADEFPKTVGKHRELFVLGMLCVSFLLSLSTTTYVSLIFRLTKIGHSVFYSILRHWIFNSLPDRLRAPLVYSA